MERCESGRIGLTANELTWETGSEGSNPSLSARDPPRGIEDRCPAVCCPFHPRARPGRSGRNRWWSTRSRCPRTAREPSGLMTPVDWAGDRAVLDRDPGLPEEPGRLRQADRDADGGGPAPGRRPGGSRPGGGQHLCLHRGGPGGVDRDGAGSLGGPPERGQAGRDRVHGRAVPGRVGRSASRGRPGRTLRDLTDDLADPRRPADRHPGGPRSEAPVGGPGGRRGTPALVRSPQPPPAPGHRALVVCEGGRGL